MALEIRRPISVKGASAEPMIPDVSTATDTNSKSATSCPRSLRRLDYPIAQVWTSLDDETQRISVCLRVGLNVCLTHQCLCGAIVKSDGLHPFACRLSAGRFPRHSAVNNIIKRSLDTAGLQSILEPSASIGATAEDQME